MALKDYFPNATPKDVTQAYAAIKGRAGFATSLQGVARDIYKFYMDGIITAEDIREFLGIYRGQKTVLRPGRKEREAQRVRARAKAWPPKQRNPFEDIQAIADMIEEDP
jgi:hypothetical protein